MTQALRASFSPTAALGSSARTPTSLIPSPTGRPAGLRAGSSSAATRHHTNPYVYPVGGGGRITASGLEAWRRQPLADRSNTVRTNGPSLSHGTSGAVAEERKQGKKSRSGLGMGMQKTPARRIKGKSTSGTAKEIGSHSTPRAKQPKYGQVDDNDNASAISSPTTSLTLGSSLPLSSLSDPDYSAAIHPPAPSLGSPISSPDLPPVPRGGLTDVDEDVFGQTVIINTPRSRMAYHPYRPNLQRAVLISSSVSKSTGGSGQSRLQSDLRTDFSVPLNDQDETTITGMSGRRYRVLNDTTALETPDSPIHARPTDVSVALNDLSSQPTMAPDSFTVAATGIDQITPTDPSTQSMGFSIPLNDLSQMSIAARRVSSQVSSKIATRVSTPYRPRKGTAEAELDLTQLEGTSSLPPSEGEREISDGSVKSVEFGRDGYLFDEADMMMSGYDQTENPDIFQGPVDGSTREDVFDVVDPLHSDEKIPYGKLLRTPGSSTSTSTIAPEFWKMTASPLSSGSSSDLSPAPSSQTSMTSRVSPTVLPVSRKGAWRGAKMLAELNGGRPASVGMQTLEDENEGARTNTGGKGRKAIARRATSPTPQLTEEKLAARMARIAHYQDLKDNYRLHVEYVLH